MTSHFPTPEGPARLYVEARRPAPDTYVITVAGDLDRHSRDRLDDSVRTVLAGRPATVLVELSGTRFMDSSGLTSLINAYRAALRTGTRFALVAPTEPVSRILALTGIDQILDSYPTYEAALRRTAR
ncbi:STAS domain-containing protein [Streptomyces sp. NPDC006527]|uniref:STAS domain-containing protein n=1 Tax=Streptomyces sp. NPDC006527 TaxID=3364749 RepID=UPI003697B162